MELTKLYHDIIDNFDDLKYALLDAQTFDPKHYGFPEIYYKIMETDQVRVNAFRRAFAHYNNLKDAVVCEAGIGRLALTQHYLLSLIHISEPTRRYAISYAVFCLKKKK